MKKLRDLFFFWPEKEIKRSSFQASIDILFVWTNVGVF